MGCKTHNPERKIWRGRSYKVGGRRGALIREIRLRSLLRSEMKELKNYLTRML